MSTSILKRMKNILITGINGFLGSHLAKALSNDYNIIGLDYSIKNLFRIKDLNLKVYSVENGIPEEPFKEQFIDIIIHTATFYGKQNESVQAIARANLFIPFELLDKAISNKCSLFINTDTVLDRYVNTYALTKRHFQEWVYSRRSEIKMFNMKLEHFYGPGSSNSNFISEMIARLRNNEHTINLTLGEQLRDFVYIDDVVSAYITVLQKRSVIEGQYNEFQVASGQLISIKELMNYLKKITSSTAHLNFGSVPYRENELMQSSTDNSNLLKLDWKPLYTISEGLNRTLKANNFVT